MRSEPKTGTAVVAGWATGRVLVLGEPLSLWGGFDPETGVIIDRLHPQCGTVITGRVVVMSAGRGSSSASSVLAEAIRLDTAPAAFVLSERDEIVALGSLVGIELYDKTVPILVLSPADLDGFTDGEYVMIEDGTVSPMSELPAGYELLRTTAEFTAETVPPGLLGAHQVADGIWGRLCVLADTVTFVFEDDAESRIRVNAGEHLDIPPRRLHHVEPGPGSRFHVEFYKTQRTDAA